MNTMATNDTHTTPFRAVHPAEIIKDELKARSMTQKELAERMGMQAPNVTRLLKGENITASIAQKLEDALGIPADFWMRLQTQYDRDIKDIAVIKYPLIKTSKLCIYPSFPTFLLSK